MEIYKSDISKDVKQPVSHTGGGSGIYANQGEISVGGMNLATQTWTEDNYISKKFFNKLFLVHGDGTTSIEANDLSTAIESLEAKIGIWTNSYISALGQNSSQGGGSGTSYNRLDAWSNYDSTKSGWVLSALLGNDLNSRLTTLENGVAPISHTHAWSDITNTPTTLNGYGITDAYISNGVIRLGSQSITPLTSHQSLAGYATESYVATNFLGIHATADNADTVDGVHLAGFGGTTGVMRSWERSAYTSANQYFGNGNVVTIDPMGTGCLSANDTILSLGDNAQRNTQLLFRWDFDGIYYRRINSATYGDWKRCAFTSDNVASATKLQTARTLWGQGFDGTDNVSGAMSGVTNINSLLYLGTNVGIGTSNPTEKLEVAGNVRVSCNEGEGLRIKNLNGRYNAIIFADSTGTDKAAIHYFHADMRGHHSKNTLNMNSPIVSLGYWEKPTVYVNSDNKFVGIGTSNPSHTLDVNGTVHATAGIYSEGYVSALGQNTSSDARLKDVQGDVDLPIDMLANAPSKAFVWKENKALGEQVGTIAQYWQKALPQVVHENNGYLAMQYDVAALLGVISVAKKVKSHEERIAELERENRELKKELKELKYERN